MRVFAITMHRNSGDLKHTGTMEVLNEEELIASSSREAETLYEAIDEYIETWGDGGYPGQCIELEIVDNEIKVKTYLCR